MMIPTWVFKILIIFLVYGPGSQAQICSEVDRAALLGFKARILTDTTGILSSWIGKDCCNGGWEGIQCDRVTGRVTQVMLQRSFEKDSAIYMKGTLSPTLGDLKFLEILVISGMKRLSVRSHQVFQARFQSFWAGSNLSLLDLSNNQLSGPIPDSLCNLYKLQGLSLSNNELTGQLPPEIGRLKSLTTLSLGFNRLVGQIPTSISQLHNLWYLNPSRNALSDPLPYDALVKGIPSLLSIDLSYKKFNLVTIPKWITSRHLSDVHLAGCNLKGFLPIFTKPYSLTSIDLSDNHVTGGITSLFQKMSSLQKVKLSNNQLRGNLSELSIPNGLAVLDLHSNQLPGSLSGLLRSAGGFLETVDLSNNQITGNIPSTISKLVGLKRFDVSRNHITDRFIFTRFVDSATYRTKPPYETLSTISGHRRLGFLN
ncbi:hypothetical protein L1987_12200 [Smallanthus sonchifolius]|uniref:Uncharacterized protein n=1 Tax=Smallanthus sonchifolius TaxID=185202 RepID=A0ACB9JD44_9ASTR|nr:hypothetical protein L1987_12200 [Smallanthus sonchifolius]